MSFVLFVVVAVIVLGSGSAKADFTFGTPVPVPNINSEALEEFVRISDDDLSLFLASERPGGFGRLDLWISTRATTHDEWGTPVNLGPPVNSPYEDWALHISPDDLVLWFSSGWSAIERPGGCGRCDIWLTMRPTKDDEWGEPVNPGPPVNSPYEDWAPYVAPDGLTLYFASNRPGGHGGHDIWVTTRETTYDAWGIPVNLGPMVNSGGNDGKMHLSADGCTLFFASKDRPGGSGSWDIWVTKRATKYDNWTTPVLLPINTGHAEGSPSLSADGSTLYFTSTRPPTPTCDIWQAPIEPVVDFNGDGIVDSTDMCIMLNHWGENYSLCDIGPTPFGDGIVDVEDLKALAEHLFEEVNDPTLIAHWPLDEIEGITAHDSVNGFDDYVMGGALWRSAGGIVDGALEFDGVDDCIITSAGLRSPEGPFSVVGWIKGGAPGQVIVSQPLGADWLKVDSEGRLMTELKGSGRDSTLLLSQTVITDEVWHRIALVWDGWHRTLCVDGVAVAKDTQNDLDASAGGLYIGVGKDYAAGTFFSGVIDDIRIYNRVVTP